MAFKLEGYKNRDSTGYIEKYNIKECRSVNRGTLRFQGFCFIIKALMECGFVDDVVNKDVQTKFSNTKNISYFEYLTVTLYSIKSENLSQLKISKCKLFCDKFFNLFYIFFLRKINGNHGLFRH